jgi:iron(III) transport system substrate-binding protein
VLAGLIRRRWPIPVIALVLVLAVAGVALATSSGDDDTLVVYNGRSHYGDETVFDDFTEETGIELTLRGGTGPELFERLQREGSDTPADVLVTTDLANLWRAENAGLLADTTSPKLEANVPEAVRDPGNQWWPLTVRLRVPVVSTKRVPEGAITSYEDLGDPKWKGRTCLRTSNSEYNQSLVADFLAKRGPEATRALLQSWMDNDPKIYNSDGELLGAMAAGDCDIGLTNHYYLARALDEDPKFPVAPAWPDQDGAGAHANVSGAGVVKTSDKKAQARKLIEYLTTKAAQVEIVKGGEFPVNEDVSAEDSAASWQTVKIDPIDVAQAGPLIPDAIELMLDLGWR